ncbi:hypothetical protein FEM33_08480 [Dyadobacter flavalbus]|uniref:Uncharacterized protein n=1 Tax=Dyadobacter flavalbus TaxID=2579942 RepID=A0A5M8QYY5_9BACT|nr:hypothetical protein [Dyadobacter flavalbus]KAA6440608.1 hypothetical protein FEM33_08480 [Dyadobacter flavalbus]
MSNPLDRIILNENAYFYTKDTNSFYSNAHITDLFVDISRNKSGNYLLNIKKQSKQIRGIPLEFSICVFKYVTIPSFIDKPIPRWEEEKIAYLLIVDFKDHVLISKKSVFSREDLLHKDLVSLDYSTLATLFVEDSTNFERFTLNNTSVSSDAIKGKTLEANDLRKSFSGFGASKYVVNSLRLSNNEEKTSIALNTSRISNYGEKRYLNELLNWAATTVLRIRTHVQKNSFLNIFATPIDYESNRGLLTPISLLFSLTRLNNHIESQEITGCELYINEDKSRVIPLLEILKSLKNVFDIEKVVSGSDVLYKVSNKLVKDIVVMMNRKSITLSSKKAKNLNFKFNDGSTENLLQYFNRHNDYIINFEDLSLVYTSRKLFKDSKLVGFIDNFLEIFTGNSALLTTTSEKGTFNTTSVGFSTTSIFHYIDNILVPASDYAFLDDLGDEWADFITLKDNKISFIHAKNGDTQLSASSFHDIVGQALKNIGNFSPSDDQLSTTKNTKWSKNYILDGITTKIPRLRNGGTVDAAVTAYEKILVSANVRKEIILVIDFISKGLLQDRLQNLQNNIAFRERSQVIQLLWIISSLINSCSENGIEIHVHCKP